MSSKKGVKPAASPLSANYKTKLQNNYFWNIFELFLYPDLFRNQSGYAIPADCAQSSKKLYA